MIKKIHTTIGLYPGGFYKINGVKPEHLEDHIEYNKVYRPGRALFLDNICIYRGNVNDVVIEEMSKKIEEQNIIMTTCTTPYV